MLRIFLITKQHRFDTSKQQMYRYNSIDASDLYSYKLNVPRMVFQLFELTRKSLGRKIATRSHTISKMRYATAHDRYANAKYE